SVVIVLILFSRSQEADMNEYTEKNQGESVSCLPLSRDLFIGGVWRKPIGGERRQVTSPSTSESLGDVAEGDENDIDAAVKAARAAFESWRRVPVLQRANIMRQAAALLRKHASELAHIDAMDGGNPV